MTSSSGVPNPTGIQLTSQQIEESTRQSYWDNAIRYGLQYYVSGRFAAASGFIPVTANLLHHAVEVLLKACLAKDDPLATIRKYGHRDNHGHDLTRLWAEFKTRHSAAAQLEFDVVVAELHKFEDIRYPETLIEGGATITMDLFAVAESLKGTHINTGPQYALSLPQVDRLMGVLFEASNANPGAYLPMVKQDAERARLYYPKIEGTFLGRKAGSCSDRCIRGETIMPRENVESMALEEFKTLQTIILKHDDVRSSIVGWNVVVITALCGAYWSDKTGIDGRGFLLLGLSIAALFTWLDVVYKVAQDRAMARAEEVEKHLRDGAPYEGPKIRESLKKDNTAIVQARAAWNKRILAPFIVLVIVVVVSFLAR